MDRSTGRGQLTYLGTRRYSGGLAQGLHPFTPTLTLMRYFEHVSPRTNPALFNATTTNSTVISYHAFGLRPDAALFLDI